MKMTKKGYQNGHEIITKVFRKKNIKTDNMKVIDTKICLNKNKQKVRKHGKTYRDTRKMAS